MTQHTLRSPLSLLGATLAAAALGACATPGMAPSQAFDPSMLPDPVKVPAGHRIAMQTVGKGEIAYECREKKDMAGQHEWVFVGPEAVLSDRAGKRVGRYYGPPATWQADDGSKVTGAQVAVAPAAMGNLPLQLVKANPAMGMGAMQGITYIQRVATRGGVAPATACAQANAGQKQIVGYQADYILWTAAM